MGIKEEVLEVLRGSEATRIRFRFDSVFGTPVAVDNTTFIRVARAIDRGDITVTSEGIDERHGGLYDGDPENGGVLRVRPIRDRRYQKSAVLHEAVHASFDLTGTTIASVDNEVAAYLANTLYLRFTHYPPARLFDRPRPSRRVYESLLRAADSIIRDGAASPAQIREVRRRLIAHPVYPDLIVAGCTNGDGETCYNLNVYNR